MEASLIRHGTRSIVLAATIVALGISTITTMPANVAIATEEATAVLLEQQSQTMEITGAPAVSVRDEFTVTLYTVVVWPVPKATSISSTFGPRSCRGCTPYHHGVDFTPGGGYPVGVVADGRVTEAQCAGALGCHVAVAHVIDGVAVTTVYGHMRAGSIRVRVGQKVHFGQTVGLVGSTGLSTGNHLHFEVHIGGVAIDPLAWIRSHATQ